MLKYRIHSIHGADQSLVLRIARLHQAAQPILLSDLGRPFVVRYFECAAKHPEVIGFYALSDAGDLLGYVVGSPRPDSLNSELMRPIHWFVGQCLRLLFLRPLVLVQAMASFLNARRRVAEAAGAVELVYIAVDTRARGHGVGRALAGKLHDASRAAGHTRVVASQELDNEASIGLFRAMGYRAKYQFHEGRYHRQRVELVL